MGEVDIAYVQDLEHRANLSTLIEAKGVPEIDLSPIFQEPPNPIAIENLVKEIGSACKEWGFLQITNHGVPLSVRQRLEEANRLFFAQSMEEKRKVGRDEISPSGYHDAEVTKNVRDWKEVFDFLCKDPTIVPLTDDENDDRLTEWTNPPLHYPPNFRDIMHEYIQEMEKLGHKLLELIALSLGLKANRFEEFFKDQINFLKLNRYPPCPSPHLVLGVGRHKDVGTLNILAQGEVEGLEVRRKSDQKWILVNPLANAFIVNVGDLIQVWSNDAYESVEHRVIVHSAAQKDRYSITFGLYPSHYTIMKPLEELTNEENPPKYRPYNWGKHLVNRKNSIFKKKNEASLQISDYRKKA